jgi:hypothetical protein
MTDLDPTAIKAAHHLATREETHGLDGKCAVMWCNRGTWANWPCEPYLLADEIERLTARQTGWKCSSCGWLATEATIGQALWQDGPLEVSMQCPQCSAEGSFVDADYVDEVDRLVTENAELWAAQQRVRTVHVPLYVNDEVTPDPLCGGCASFREHNDCLTLAALDGAESGLTPQCRGYLGGGIECEKPQGHPGQCWDAE